MFGFTLTKGLRSPTLDRIIPELGYVPGNVIVVSNKANMIKTNASLDDLEMVHRFYLNLIRKHHP